MKHAELSERIIAAFYQVYNTLGWGFLEKVYRDSLLHELSKRGMKVEPNAKIEVYYDGLIVGTYFADLLVEDKIILELKSAETLAPKHESQILNYLKATSIEVGLLLNFGPKPQIKRKVFDENLKPPRPTVALPELPDPNRDEEEPQ